MTRILSVAESSRIALDIWTAVQKEDGCIYRNSNLKIVKIHLDADPSKDFVIYVDKDGVPTKEPFHKLVELVAARYW